jgi:N utilization substance protein B
LDKHDSAGIPDFDPEKVIATEVIEQPIATNERSIVRRVTLQALYEIDSSGHPVGAVLNELLMFHHFNPKNLAFLDQLVTGVIAYTDRLDAIIQDYAPEWPMDQVAIVDRNILRMALYEFAVLSPDLLRVVIDEAVTLGRLFGADSTSRFVNGVLGALARDIDKVQLMLKETES